MIKIVAVADTHREYRKIVIPKVDICIHAGDIDLYRYKREFDDFNDWLGELPTRFNICIGGNHDGFLEDRGFNWVKENLTNGIYLENSEVVIEGIKFWGSPITPEFYDWSFMRKRGEEINHYWKLIPSDTTVLVTHGPPYGVLDKTTMANGDEGSSEGCLDLLNRVKELKQLKFHCFGHMHRNGGKTIKIGNTTFINASVMDESYELVNFPIIFEV